MGYKIFDYTCFAEDCSNRHIRVELMVEGEEHPKCARCGHEMTKLLSPPASIVISSFDAAAYRRRK